jgi:metal-responsive CopG/Arc/MetJ family transcriptional regulator
MSDLVRISMTIERPLLEQMDRLTGECGAENRSKFLRDLLRTHLRLPSLW